MLNLEYIGAENYQISNEKGEKMKINFEEMKEILKKIEKNEKIFSEKNKNGKSLFDWKQAIKPAI